MKLLRKKGRLIETGHVFIVLGRIYTCDEQSGF